MFLGTLNPYNMKNSSVQRVVLLGALAILFIIGQQTYMVMQTWNAKERDFDRSVNIALLNVAKQLSNVNQTVLPLQQLIKRTTSNSYAVNINSQINASNLDYYLRTNFEEASLNEDFDYSIYDCHDEEMVYGKYVSYSASADSSACALLGLDAVCAVSCSRA